MGHLVNPVSFRLGRSLFWQNIFVYTNNNYRLLKKKNFLFKFVLKTLDWFFNEKLSLNFFYYRYKTYKKILYLNFFNNIQTLFINKKFFFNKLLKIALFLKKKYIFYIYRRNILTSFGNVVGRELVTLKKLVRSYYFIDNVFFGNLINGDLDDISLDLFFWFYKELLERPQVGVIREPTPYYIRVFKYLNHCKMVLYLRRVWKNQIFVIFNYGYNYFMDLIWSRRGIPFRNKKLASGTKKIKNNNVSVVQVNIKKKFFYILNCLLNRLKFMRFYVFFLDGIQQRVKRQELRFLKLEVIDIQLFLIANKIKINVLMLKEKTLKFFYEQKMKEIYQYFFFKKRIKFYNLVKQKLINLKKIFCKINLFLMCLDISLLQKIFLRGVYFLKKIVLVLKNLKKKYFSFLNLFGSNLLNFKDLKMQRLLLLLWVNKLFLTSLNGLMFQRLLRNIFFNLGCDLKFLMVDNTLLNASIIFKFIHVQLTAKRPIYHIMKVVYKELLRYKKYDGFKILLRGRFTRKERAFHQIWQYGSVPLSTVVKPIDYYSHFFISKFGVGSIRIWLFRKL